MAQDTYTRSDTTSTWGLASDGANTWIVLRGTSTFFISGNKGAVKNNSGAYCIARCGTVTSNDSDQTVSITRVDTNDVAGLAARIGDANNWYSVNIGEYANNLTISKFVGGAFTDLAFGANATYATTTTWNVRFQVLGTNLKAKIWDSTLAEPGSWTVTTTDSSLSTGGVGVIADPWTATPLTFDDYTATDGSSVTTNSITFTDQNTLSESLLAAVLTALDEYATVTESISFVPTVQQSEGNGTTDILTFFLATQLFDLASQTEQIDLQPQALISDVLFPSDIVTISTTIVPIEQLIAGEQLSLTSQSTTQDSLSSSESMSTSAIFMPIDLLTLTEGFSYLTLSTYIDLSSNTEFFTVSFPTPSSSTAITLIGADGKLILVSRDGTVTLLGRDGFLTLGGK